MTRETDEFLRLDDRVRIARQHDADLFISVHADTIKLKGIRGATVYTVSDKASDAEAQALADRENLSDQLAGIEIEEDEPRGRRYSDRPDPPGDARFSIRFARSLVEELSPTGRPHQQSAPLCRLQGAEGARRAVGAGRTGLSLERQGRGAAASAEWRGKAATSIAEAIAAFAAAKSGAAADVPAGVDDRSLRAHHTRRIHLRHVKRQRGSRRIFPTSADKA